MRKVGVAIAAGFLGGVAAAIGLIGYRAPELDLATLLPDWATRPTAQEDRPAEPEGELPLADILELPSDFEQSATLHRQLANADRATLLRLLTQASELEPARQREPVLATILTKLVETDPLAAVAWAQAIGRGDDHIVDRVFAAWARQDPEAALAHAYRLPGTSGRTAALAILTVAEDFRIGRKRSIAEAFSVVPAFERMLAREGARRDPQAAWQDALPRRHLRSEQLRADVLWEIARTWADADPREALAAVAALPQSGQRTTWLAGLAEHWARRDREAATAWALGQPPSPERARTLANITRLVALDDPQQALAFAESLQPGGARGRALAAVVKAWAPQDARSAYHWARSRPPSASRATMVAESLRHLAASEPFEAFMRASRLGGRERRLAMDATLHKWAKDNVRAAANWVGRSGGRSVGDRERELQTVLGVWARDDARAAAAWVDATHESSPVAVAEVARHYAVLDPVAALDWLLSQSRPVQRAAVRAAVDPWVRDTPAVAARAVERIRDPHVRASGLAAVGSAWGETDPTRALRWSAGIPDLGTRLAVRAQVLAGWARFDAKGARDHVARVRDAWERDTLALALITTLMHDDPAVSEGLYADLTDDGIRRQAAEHLYWYWQDRDPNRAARYRAVAGA